MDHVLEFAAYLWERLPLLLLFLCGWLSYRLLAVTGLTDWAVRRAVAGSRGDPCRLVLYVIASTALLSAFIPNTVAVLAVLPVLTALDREHSRRHSEAPMTTALALAAMYGANVGGVGSLIGSPANLILVGFLDLYQVPGREQISFLTWLLWGLPLAALLAALGWGLIAALAVPKSLRRGRRLDLGRAPASMGSLQFLGAKLYVFFLGFWTLEALLQELWPAFDSVEPVVCLGFTVWFGLECFRPRGQRPGRVPLLKPGQMFGDLPVRALVFLAILGGVMIAANLLDLDQAAARFFQGFIGAVDSPLLLCLGFTLVAVFLTEILSNTVVAVALFPVVYFTALAVGLPPLAPMIAVSVGATCAFMTPVATPPNALAYGALRGVSLRAMLGLGLLMNLLSALVMAGWLNWIIPLVYG